MIQNKPPAPKALSTLSHPLGFPGMRTAPSNPIPKRGRVRTSGKRNVSRSIKDKAMSTATKTRFKSNRAGCVSVLRLNVAVIKKRIPVRSSTTG
jgi:hypothetical protein